MGKKFFFNIYIVKERETKVAPLRFHTQSLIFGEVLLNFLPILRLC